MFSINEMVEVVSITGLVEVGQVIGFKKVKQTKSFGGGYGKIFYRSYPIVQITYPAADGEFKVTAAYKPEQLRKIK